MEDGWRMEVDLSRLLKDLPCEDRKRYKIVVYKASASLSHENHRLKMTSMLRTRPRS